MTEEGQRKALRQCQMGVLIRSGSNWGGGEQAAGYLESWAGDPLEDRDDPQWVLWMHLGIISMRAEADVRQHSRVEEESCPVDKNGREWTLNAIYLALSVSHSS